MEEIRPISSSSFAMNISVAKFPRKLSYAKDGDLIHLRHLPRAVDIPLERFTAPETGIPGSW